MLINCDIGERGVAHSVDDKLMKLIDIANIACGGHAGNEESIHYYKNLAKENGVKITAHLSYPDRENFGRKTLNISKEELHKSLDEQYAFMNDVKVVKFHGALYNDANKDENLAKVLMTWLKQNDIKEILTPYDSYLDKLSLEIDVLHEAFLDRMYIVEDNSLVLSHRSMSGAVITESLLAMKQYEGIKNEKLLGKSIKASTLCLHSDNENALDILKSIKGV